MHSLSPLTAPLIALLTLLPSQTSALDFYAEAGYHKENLGLSLVKKKDRLQENFDKVRWSNISSPEIRLGASQCLQGGYTLEAEGGFLLNTSSKSTFSSRYREDIGSRPFIRRLHHKGRFSGNDFSFAVGYAILLCPQVQFTTLIGYAEQRRKIHFHPGEMTTCMEAESDPQTVTVPAMQLNARWQGPWAGLRIGYRPYQHLHVLLDAQYHYTLLRTNLDSQIQEQLGDGYQFDSRVSTRQHGNAQGFKINAALIHGLCDKWKLVLHGYYAWLCNTNGKDSTKHTQTVSKPNQNPISQGSFRTAPHYRTLWHAWALLGGIDYEF